VRQIHWLEIALAASFLTLFFQLVPPLTKWWHQKPRPGVLSRDVAFGDRNGKVIEIKYLLYLPDDYSKQKRWPLLLFLHGSGQRGHEVLRVAMCGPPYAIAQGKLFPMIIVSPQCHEGESWQSEQLLALLEQLEKSFSIDCNRLYVAGYSMGGYGTWDLVSTAPDRFAAAVPVAGGGSIDQAERLVTLPIWAFHGAHDDVIPLDESQRMVEAVRDKGGHARLTVLDDQAHGICNLVFSRDDLYEWLLHQRRSLD
jgi:predicted peptidase